jgi:hypothetical protein
LYSNGVLLGTSLAAARVARDARRAAAIRALQARLAPRTPVGGSTPPRSPTSNNQHPHSPCYERVFKTSSLFPTLEGMIATTTGVLYHHTRGCIPPHERVSTTAPLEGVCTTTRVDVLCNREPRGDPHAFPSDLNCHAGSWHRCGCVHETMPTSYRKDAHARPPSPRQQGTRNECKAPVHCTSLLTKATLA